MSSSLRIAIVTSGRFHVCDLARELSKQGHTVAFYTLVPPSRARKFGLPQPCHRWLLPRVAWSAAKVRWARSSIQRARAVDALTIAIDRAVCRMIEPCDVVIGMSGMCNELGRIAKKKYGSQIWIERGSRHILSQKSILENGPSGSQVSSIAIERELKDYDQADYLSLLSKHCETSFLEQGFSSERIVRNPLGVDLQMFASTPAPRPEEMTVLTVGHWSWRKGCDILLEAWRKMNPQPRLWHVGSVTDLALPNDSGFRHFDRVDQSQLRSFYAQSHVFAMCSREEGLATVQPQALSCGLRLVCTTNTGGEDIRDLVSAHDRVIVVPVEDVEGLRSALEKSCQEARYDRGLRDYLTNEDREELSWKGYGRRYSCNLLARK